MKKRTLWLLVIATVLISGVSFSYAAYRFNLRMRFVPKTSTTIMQPKRLFIKPTGIPQLFCVDADKDGYCTNKGQRDCNDRDPAIHPGANEVCDGVDNNCDKQIDNGFTYLATADGKRVGDECIVGVGACERSGKYLCNKDGSSLICSSRAGNPGPEICNDVDDDCDGQVDENLSVDTDGDGLYAPGSCLEPATDCDEPYVFSGYNGGCVGDFSTPIQIDSLPISIKGSTQVAEAKCYEFSLDSTRDVSINTYGGSLGNCDGLDSALILYRGGQKKPGFRITQNDDSAGTVCAAISTRLTEGSYKVCVTESNGDALGGYILDINTETPLNSEKNNTCYQAQQLVSASGMIYGSYNGAYDNLKPLNKGKCAGIYGVGPDRYYRVDIAQGERLTVQLTADVGDEVVYLLKDCPYRHDSCVAAADKMRGSAGETLQFVNQGDSGTFFIVVDNNEPLIFGDYQLTWSIR